MGRLRQIRSVALMMASVLVLTTFCVALEPAVTARAAAEVGQPVEAAPSSAAPPALSIPAKGSLPTSAEASAIATAKASGQRTEVVSEQSATGNVFAEPSGAVTQQLFPAPVRARVAGQWKSLDATLSANAAGQVTPAVPSTPMTFSGGGIGPAAQLAAPLGTVGLGWASALPKPTLSASTATYANVSAGTDLSLVSRPSSFEVNVILKSRPTTAPVINLPVTIPAGDKLTTLDSGIWMVQTADGQDVAEIGSSEMHDASIDPATKLPGTLKPVDSAITSDGNGGFTLTLRPDMTFLSDPATKYPVTIDPTTQLVDNLDTMVINGSLANTNYDSSSDLYVGLNSAYSTVSRTYVRFTDSAIKGKYVTLASLGLLESTSATCTAKVTDVKSATILATGRTWNTQPTLYSTVWGSVNSNVGTGNSCGSGAVSIPLTSMMAAWATNGVSSPDTLAITAASETDSSQFKDFFSADTAYGPHIDVTYASVPGAPTSAHATSGNKQATVTWTAPSSNGGAPITSYKVTSSPGGKTATVTSGTTATVTGLTNGTAYNFVVTATNGAGTSAGSTASNTVTGDAAPNPPASVTPSAQSYITNPSGQLSAVVSDPDGGNVQASWYVTDTTTSTVIINSGLSASVPSGSTATYPLAGTLTDGHQYSVKARACDASLCSAWTTTTTSTADFTPPATPSISSATYPANNWHSAGGSGAFTLSDTGGDLDHYLYSLDSATPTTSTSTSLTINPMPDGWHTLSVRAVDHAGLLSGITTYSFGATPAFTAVSDGGTTSGLVSLSANAASGYSGVTINYRRSDTDSWTALPTGDVTQGGTTISAWPVTALSGSVPGTSPAVSDSTTPTNLVWNAASTLAGQDGPLQLQVCFDSACSTSTVHLTLDQQELGGSYATASVGPGSLSLLTGSLAVGAGDVSVTTATSSLDMSRTFNTRYPTSPSSGILGSGWTASLPVNTNNWTAFSDTGSAVTLTAADGSKTNFAKTSTGYTATGNDKGTGITLTAGTAGTYGPTSYTFADLLKNQVTFSPAATFTANASLTTPHAYRVSSVTEPGSGQTTSYSYNGSGLPTQELAPIPSGAACTNPSSVTTWTAGCEALSFGYDTNSHLNVVTLVTNTGSTVLSVDLACYGYDTSGRLAQEWDPRNGTAGTGSHPVTCGTAVLPTAYGYNTSGQLTSITPPGLAAWQLSYDTNGRLTSAARTHNATFGSGTETTNVAYNISLTPDGSHPEYRPDLTAATAATWAQTDTPATATVVYPPGSNVSSTDLRDGEVHYLDVNSQEVNTADYAGSGAAGWHITTSEYDSNGNTIRTLTAANREEALTPTTGAGSALGLPSDTAAAALALSDQSIFTTASDGVTDLTDTFGPYHLVTLANGTAIAAREQTHDTYDTGSETGHPSGGSLHLVMTETTGASESISTISTNEQDIRETDNAYALSGTDATGWTFGSPMKVTEDPAGLARTTITRYDPTTGNVIESRMPSNTAGGAAGTTLTIYYTAGTNSQDSACGSKPAWAGLLCETTPAAQPGVSGLPGLVTKRITSYDYLNRATVQADMVTDASGTQQTRTTTTTYLNSGYGDRTSQVTITGGLGAAVPTVSTSYDSGTGLPTTTSAAATTENAATSATTGYDDFGRTISYVDADEATGAARNATTTTYDSAGRISQISDAHTTRTFTYNENGEHRNLPTSMAVTVNSSTTYSGTFTTTYDADGNSAVVTDPNGISTTAGTDENGQLLSETSIKVSDGTPWLADTATTSIDGQLRSESNAAGTHTYSYDKLGRLTTATDTATLGVCSTNNYALDIDSNRTSSTNYPAATTDGSCQNSTGAVTTSHGYDSADRLQSTGNDTGLTYDAYGRTTTLPASDAGGTTLTNAYYANDLVRSQAQNGITQCWTLDAASRLKQHTTYTGSNCSATLSATTTNHYDHPTSDSPEWIAETADSSQWTANASDANGLALTVTQAGAATYQYDNLHGDVIATATSATTLSVGADYDEYGNTSPAQVQRYGWLGGAERSGDALGATLLMGARVYVPGMGRFLQTDPIARGSANAYDYANQDPINETDVSGKDPLWDGWLKILNKYMGRAFSEYLSYAHKIATKKNCVLHFICWGHYYNKTQQSTLISGAHTLMLWGAGVLMQQYWGPYAGETDLGFSMYSMGYNLQNNELKVIGIVIFQGGLAAIKAGFYSVAAKLLQS